MTIRASRMRPIHPGEILREDYIANGVSVVSLARCMGVDRSLVDLLCAEGMPVNEYLAGLLSKALGTSPEFWLNLQAAYDRSIDE